MESAPLFPSVNAIGHRVLSFTKIESTNAEAALYADDPANHGLVVTAESQTAGRGQYNRVWQAQPGSSILLSVLLFPPANLLRPSILTAWAAVSVCETIRQVAGEQARIKWPNDILIHGKKVCGILCEGKGKSIIAGIGLNVNQAVEDFEKLDLPAATSLSICAGSRFDVSELTRQFIRQLDLQYQRLSRDEIAVLEMDWKGRFELVGKWVFVEKMDGSELQGLLVEMSFAEIELRLGDGTKAVFPPESIRHLHQAK